MNPPVFALAAADAAVVAKLKTGSGPLRVWQFGLSPQKEAPFYAVPYAVWQFAYGSPENYLGDRPDIDNPGVQIDVYAANDGEARSIAQTLQYAMEAGGYVVGYRGEEKDVPTGLSRSGFDVEFWVNR